MNTKELQEAVEILKDYIEDTKSHSCYDERHEHGFYPCCGNPDYGNHKEDCKHLKIDNIAKIFISLAEDVIKLRGIMPKKKSIKDCGIDEEWWNKGFNESRDLCIKAMAGREVKAIEIIRLILPLAKGYAYQNQVGSNQKYIEMAEHFLDEIVGKEEKP